MYKFEESYKLKFRYKKDDGTFWQISGDIYRDVFNAEMTEDEMDYFKSMSHSDIEVTQLHWDGTKFIQLENVEDRRK